MAVTKQIKIEPNFVINGIERSSVQFVKDVEAMLVTNVKSAMEKLGARFALELSKNAPVSSGALSNPNNFFVEEVRETKTGYSIAIRTGTEYTDYIDKGVRGIKHSLKNKKVYKNKDGRYYQFRKYGMPLAALESLQGWMERKNMETQATNLRIKYKDDSLRGRTYLPQISTPVKTLAYYIKKYGIEGQNFQQKSLDAVMDGFKMDIRSIGADSLVLKFNIK